MAKAVVKSSQDRGSRSLRRVSSRARMRSVVKQQKHQENMHQAQYESPTWPADAATLKETQESSTSSIRTTPTGTVSVCRSRETMAIRLRFERLAGGPFRFHFSLSRFPPLSLSLSIVLRIRLQVISPLSLRLSRAFSIPIVSPRGILWPRYPRGSSLSLAPRSPSTPYLEQSQDSDWTGEARNFGMSVRPRPAVPPYQGAVLKRRTGVFEGA